MYHAKREKTRFKTISIGKQTRQGQKEPKNKEKMELSLYLFSGKDYIKKAFYGIMKKPRNPPMILYSKDKK